MFSSFLPVAVAVELQPTMLAAFYVCKDEEKRGGEMREAKIMPRRASKSIVKCRNMEEDKIVRLIWEEKGSRWTICFIFKGGFLSHWRLKYMTLASWEAK